MAHLSEQQLEELTAILSEDPDVVAVYLFGSRAAGRASLLSDVDLGVILSSRFQPEGYFEKRLELLTATTRVLRTNNVDLVIVNECPPLLAHRIFRHGRLLLSKDELARTRLQARVLSTYLDTKPMRDLHGRALVRRAKKGRFGAGQ